MASEYTVEQFLLDRANVEDVVKTMYFFYDSGDTSSLSKRCLAPSMLVDYTAIAGGTPSTVSAAEFEQMVAEMLKGMKRTMHAVTGVVSHFPQPGTGPRPDSVKAVAYGVVAMLKTSGPLVQDGAIVYLDLIRTEAKNENPWRISGLRADLVFVTHGEDKSDTPFL